MNWFFTDYRIIIEEDTGFTVRLISGTWANPEEVQPNKTDLNTYDQARLLRLGLEYARAASLEKKVANL